MTVPAAPSPPLPRDLTSPGLALSRRHALETTYLSRLRGMLRRKDVTEQDWASLGLTPLMVNDAKADNTLSGQKAAYEALAGRVRTQATIDFNSGQIERAPKGSVKVWVSRRDARTREAHLALDGRTARIGRRFRSGNSWLMYPGDPHGPDHLVRNCRCVVVIREGRDVDVRTLASRIIQVFKQSDQEKSQQAKKQVRVPKGQPGGGQFKDMPEGVVKDLVAALSKIGSANGIKKKSTAKKKPVSSYLKAGIPAATAKKLPACKSAKGPGPCYWDAAKHGGKGMSHAIDEKGNLVKIKPKPKPRLVKATPAQIAALEKKYGVKVPKGMKDVMIDPKSKNLVFQGKGPDGKTMKVYTPEYAKKAAARKSQRLKKVAAKQSEFEKALKNPKTGALALLRAAYKAGLPTNIDAKVSVKKSSGGYIVTLDGKDSTTTYEIVDHELVSYLEKRLKKPKQRLFQAAGDEKSPDAAEGAEENYDSVLELFGTDKEQVVADATRIGGPGTKPSDLRLLRANEEALAYVQETPAPTSENVAAWLEALGERVGRSIGVGAQVALDSWVDPDLYEDHLPEEDEDGEQ